MNISEFRTMVVTIRIHNHGVNYLQLGDNSQPERSSTEKVLQRLQHLQDDGWELMASTKKEPRDRPKQKLLVLYFRKLTKQSQNTQADSKDHH